MAHVNAAADTIGYEAQGLAQGLKPYNPSDPLASQYRAVAMRNLPSGINGTHQTDFYNQAEAVMRARGMIYFKNQPGDCGSPTMPGGTSNSQIVGLAGEGASLTVGGLGAVGVLSGAATFGIGAAVTLAVAGISDIFTHHAKAVANEQATICAVANYLNPAIKTIDDAVASGAITPGQGLTYVQQVGNAAKQGLQGIRQQCNAACWWEGYINCLVDITNQFYPLIAPQVMALRPGQPPTAFGSLPGGVPATNNNPAPIPPIRSIPIPGSAVRGSIRTPPSAVQSSRQPTGQGAQITPVPPTAGGLGWGFFAVVAAILVLLFAGMKPAAEVAT